MTEDERRPGASVAVGVALVVLLGLVALWAQPNEADAELSARTNCQLAVRDRQLEPNATDFSLVGSDVRESPSGFIVTGTVDVKDVLGVRRTLRYRCAADDSGMVLDVTVLPVTVPPLLS